MKLINFYNTLQSSLILLFFATQSSCSSTDTPTFQPPVSAVTDAKFYLTTPSKSSLLELQTTGTSPLTENSNFTINVNPNATFQTMDGFGYTLTGGSAQLIQNMSVSAKNALLEELFGQGPESIKVSYLRISVGASDLDASVFSYNDLPAGQTDVALTNFSIAPDLVSLIPILNQIKTLNPNIKIVASPWSAPTWMKSNQSTIGGELQPIYYQTYANYFVKYIQAMQANNIAIDAITIQN